MLAVFFGNDTIKVRQKAYNYAESKKEDGMEMVGISADKYESGFLLASAMGNSLFGGSTLYVIDTPSEDETLQAEVTDALDQMAASNNIFVIIEGTLLAADKKVFARAASVMDEYKKTADAKFNNFALADALAKRDKKLLWLLLAEARLTGAKDEEVIGILWWQLKTMRLAKLASSAAAAGLKDYPYDKAKRALAKFAPGEVEKISHHLIQVLHDSRLGKVDLDIALERFVLSI